LFILSSICLNLWVLSLYKFLLWTCHVVISIRSYSPVAYKLWLILKNDINKLLLLFIELSQKLFSVRLMCFQRLHLVSDIITNFSYLFAIFFLCCDITSSSFNVTNWIYRRHIVRKLKFLSLIFVLRV
jgi:hypothetical protein